MRLFILAENLSFIQRVKLLEPLFFGAITLLFGKNLVIKFNLSPSDRHPKNKILDTTEWTLPDSGVTFLTKSDLTKPSSPLFEDDR
ncbi:hypothetical protein M2407_000917 [Serratia sp. BIGb0234]|uniref:hypothetical protein n=1 Tax=Serratia sp. BIGb0234 TaxID=2940614 RepID=UPI00216838A5|nr:hypothetical protein [Serratia sp. BIGb0234]MCS4316618.1 hypothetical protein [Serratia sp. BIGb0234]